MNERYVCYCGLYCENCATKAKVEPAAKTLFHEMKKAGFESVVPFLPDGEGFWRFLKSVAEEGTCVSCKEGSGNPWCAVRICAKDKGVEMCALCEHYPCEKFEEFFATYPILKSDNDLIREKGYNEWNKMQAERKAKGFAYTD